MTPPIFDGLSWGTMLAAVDDVVTELERCAAELRAIVDRYRPVDVPRLAAVLAGEPGATLPGEDAAPLRLIAAVGYVEPSSPLSSGRLVIDTRPLEPLNGRLRVLELELESSPIAGRPGWRVDRAGREWYSSSWLDRGPV